MENILKRYSVLKNCRPPQPFGNGHINDTYLVETPAKKYILQRVNPKIFNTPVLIRNLAFLYNALQTYEKQTGKKLTPEVLKNDRGGYHTLDSEKAAWRLMTFYPGCRSYSISPDEKISFEAARTTGDFQLFLNTLPAAKFGQTIPAFHNTPGRLKTFISTLEKAPGNLKSKAAPEIDFVLQNQNIADEVEKLQKGRKLPLRVTHNDTKLENILFTANNEILIIDLDTIMPGSVIFDYGDMVRSFTTSAGEDEPDLTWVKFRTAHFAALTKGYLQPLKQVLTQEEKNALLTGAKAIIFEQAIRFLNDFLEGNIYYKTDYPEHNLVRTRTQIRLLHEILQKEDQLQEIIYQHS